MIRFFLRKKKLISLTLLNKFFNLFFKEEKIQNHEENK